MASWYRRRGGKAVTVYYYDKLQQKNATVPRAQTKHLDDLPDADIDSWVNDWADDNGHKVHRAIKHSLSETDELNVLWQQFQKYWQKLRKLTSKTIKARDTDFQIYVIPYFVGMHGEKNVRNWYKYVGDFSLYMLTESGLKNEVDVKKKIWMIRRFGEYLVSVPRIIAQPWVLMMPATADKAETPLRLKVAPDEVMAEVRRLLARSEIPNLTKMKSANGKTIGRRKTLYNNDRQMALALLLGYFASLGPGEVYGLHKEDLVTGEAAIEAVKGVHPTFKAHSLGSKLTLSIERQLGNDNIEIYPKNDYRFGPAHVWNVEAARLISALVKEMEPGRLFRLSRARLDKLHARTIKPALGVTAHDLRRASALYLGRTVKITLEVLQKHLRHAEIETTMLYIREPKISEEKAVVRQDFDDVG